MRRGLMVAGLVVIALAVTTACAQAQMYGSLRFAGPMNMKEFAVGMQSGSLGGEIAVGYWSGSITDLDNIDESLESVEPELSIMSFGGTVFMQIMSDDNYGFDLGVRYQYLSFDANVTVPVEEPLTRDDEELSAKLSGWSAGPLLRGRWYLVEDSIAIGPEIYFKYSSYSTELEAMGDTVDGPGATGMELEYSLRMDFHF
ncbi:MAG: hypothetical protein GF400_02860 [Candidatus Eisenbacteria bacterium]|nr:hypothetical protein [Candidatus Eisenbacteria bacterium]